jgi:hypothetical protein
MRSEKVEEFLTSRGYKYYAPNGFDSKVVIANYYRIDYAKGVPLCISNDKPPQFGIRENYIPKGEYGDNPEVHGFEISICNHAPQAWMDFKFYGVSEKQLIDGLDEFEAALLKAWSALFADVCSPVSGQG